MRTHAFACAVSLIACTEKTPDKPTKHDTKILEKNLLKKAPSPKQPVNAELGGKVVYLGLDAPETVAPGRSLRLVHYWQVKEPLGDDWKLFVHINAGAKNAGDKQGFLNADHVPVKGRYPVSQWKAGDIIRDEHTVRIPQGWQADSVNVYVGFFKGADRMPITSGPKDDQNRVLATKIALKAEQPGAGKRRFAARKAQGAIAIDGVLAEEDWKPGQFTAPFTNTMTDAPSDIGRTVAKVLWNDTHLYVAFEVQDTDIRSTLKKHDDKLWTQDVVEMFIDFDGDAKDYIELQVSPAGVTFDSYLPGYRKNENDWESGIKAAVKLDGTLNDKQADQGYTVEFSLPLEAVKGKAKDKTLKKPGEPGAMWKVNWFRMDGSGKEQKAVGWSAPLVGDFHKLDKFGDLRFTDASKRGTTQIDGKRMRGMEKVIRTRVPGQPK